MMVVIIVSLSGKRDGALLRATDRQERTAPGRKEAFHFKNEKKKRKYVFIYLKLNDMVLPLRLMRSCISAHPLCQLTSAMFCSITLSLFFNERTIFFSHNKSV